MSTAAIEDILPSEDCEFLRSRHPNHQVTIESGMICIVLPGWPLPVGYTHPEIDLLLRLQPGYPDLPPDMWWVFPHLTLASGQPIAATEQHEVWVGREWQRWSRHLPEGAWASGVDNLQSYLAQVRTELERTASAAA